MDVPLSTIRNEVLEEVARSSVSVDRMEQLSVGEPMTTHPDPSNSSSIDISAVDISSKGATLTADRIRRRSDLPRNRPSHISLSGEPEVIELPVLSPISDVTTPETETPGVHPAGNVFWADSTATDVEIANTIPNSLASSIHGEDAASENVVVTPAQKAIYRWKARMHFGALCWCFFLMGWDGGTTGPLLPTIQASHHIGFATVSLLFVMNTVGYISGSFSNVYLSDKFGFGKVLFIGSLFQLSAYAMIASGGTFGVMLAAFLLLGFGISLQNAQAGGFVGSLKKNVPTKLGFLHASYGLGAFSSPLAATQFATSPHWYHHYLISAGIAVTNSLVLAAVFRFRPQDDVMAEAGIRPEIVESERRNKYRQMFALPTLHLLSAWALIYVGVEVTLGGWIVTFVEQKRGGGASAGYISSGFFGGLMLGRVVLMWLNKKIGERRVMFIYTFLAIQLEVTIWVVPSLLENAVAVSCIGLLLGPMYPILMNYCTDVLPRWLLTGCVGWIGGIGQTGSAVLPFITGLLASRFGIESLQPFIVSMMSTMVVIWAFVPRARRVD